MSSRASPINGHFIMNHPQGHMYPQPATRESSRSRDIGGHPPTLSTAISNVSTTNYSLTPASATSLSSPFSLGNTSPYPSSAGTVARGMPAIATRLATPYNAPYNPQEWGRVQEGQNLHAHQVQAPVVRAPDEGRESPPPPPYSQRSEPAGSNGALSPEDQPPANAITNGTSLHIPGNVNVPLAAAALSEQHTRQRPASMYHYGQAGAGSSQNYFAPPPTERSSSSSRVNSRFGLDRLKPGNPVVSVFSSSSRTPGPPVPRGSVGNMYAPERSHQSRDISPAPLGIAPGSRRAMSADAYSTSDHSSISYSTSRDSSSSRNWAPGMALPGPPAGPPPAASRSTSASGMANPTSAQLLRPATRPRNYQAPTLGTRLEPPPPTPADWTGWEDDGSSLRTRSPGPPSNVTSSEQSSSQSSVASEIPPQPLASSQGLTRSAAKRDPSAKGLRDRRNSGRPASRGMSLVVDVNYNADHSPSNSPFAPPTLSPEQLAGIVRSEESTPTQQSDPPNRQRNAPFPIIDANSRSPLSPRRNDTHSTIATKEPADNSTKLSMPTPPLSPGRKPPRLRVNVGASTAPPRALPTPHSAGSSQFRPISHILHLPNDDKLLSAYLSPSDTSSAIDSAISPIDSNNERLIHDSIERHRAFIVQEQTAQGEEEKLRIFSEYILAESRLRRARYGKAWKNGSFDARTIREQLFELPPPAPGRFHSRASSNSGSTAGLSSEPPTPGSAFSGQARPESQWWSSYQPALSPIASMSNDEVSSRGRTSSRWWESQTGSEGGSAGHKVHRTKRESKYMGLQRDALTAESTNGLPSMAEYPDESESPKYPDEKANPDQFGVYDEDRMATPFGPHAKQPERPWKLDVSRFVTLPPPYPRHYPAVNNIHPALSAYRLVVRTCSDMSEIGERRSRNVTGTEALRKEHDEKLKENRHTFRTNIQAQINEGSISYADAAEAEQAFKADEDQLEKRMVQAVFDSFQDVLLNPLHNMLNERVTKLTAAMRELEDMLSGEAEVAHLDQTQEEGDEQPELLEKLTLLKWLFETREQMHQEIFQLLTERNDKYKAIVLLPYQQAKNAAKEASTDQFFIQDQKDRKATFRRESFARYGQFLHVVEENIRRGIEMQSCTYWDIAPGLLDLVQQVPEDLYNFEGVQIPDEEYAENPTYHQHPLQYLYSLMTHAERSTYQFIESQTNLQCLLHAAKTAVAGARCKSSQAECEKDGGDMAVLKQMSDLKLEEEATLTAELRQTTSMIEQQWLESLGGQIQGAKQRIKLQLMEQGGWEQMERDEE